MSNALELEAKEIANPFTEGDESGGGVTGETGLTQNTVRARKTELILITAGVNNTASNNAFPPRVVYAQLNRKYLIFRSLPGNEVNLQFGMRLADNIQNANADFTVSHTLLPGEEVVIAGDRAQWFLRQTTTSPTPANYEVEEVYIL